MISRKQVWFVGLVALVVALVVGGGVVMADCGKDHSASAKTSGVQSFEDCVRETGRILKSYPAKCVSHDGKVFVDTPKEPKAACEDLCGDGKCAEMVCMAVGCPCAESAETCPKDCAGQ